MITNFVEKLLVIFSILKKLSKVFEFMLDFRFEFDPKPGKSIDEALIFFFLKAFINGIKFSFEQHNP